MFTPELSTSETSGNGTARLTKSEQSQKVNPKVNRVRLRPHPSQSHSHDYQERCRKWHRLTRLNWPHMMETWT